jgi:heme-degrading monooxygenase HmoA
MVNKGAVGFVRQIPMKVKSGKIDEYVKVMEKSVFPRTRRCRGARRLYLLRSHGKKGKTSFVVMTLWDNEEAAEGYAKSDAYEKNSAELLPLIVSEPKLDEYEVVVHDVVK